jgi:hypothetical protein
MAEAEGLKFAVTEAHNTVERANTILTRRLA